MEGRRVYELARELGIPTGRILDAAREVGLEGFVAVSRLNDEQTRMVLEELTAGLLPLDAARLSVHPLVRELGITINELSIVIPGAPAVRRVYELAEITGTTAKQVMDAAAALGIPARSSLAGLTFEHQVFIAREVFARVAATTDPDESFEEGEYVLADAPLGEGVLEPPPVAALPDPTPARTFYGPLVIAERPSRVALAMEGLPKTAIMTWVALLPLHLSIGTDDGSVVLALADVVLAAAFILLLPQIRLRTKAWSLWHFVVPVALGVSLLFSGPTPFLTGRILGMVALLAGYALITTFVRSWTLVHRLMRTFVTSVVLVTSVAVLVELFGGKLPLSSCHPPDCTQLAAYLPDAHIQGSIVVVALALLLGTLHSEARLYIHRSVTVFALIALITGLILTQSASAWIVTATIATVFVTLRWVKTRRRLALFGAGGLSFASVVLLAGRSDFLVSLGESLVEVNSRPDLVESAVAAFNEKPLIGIGLGGFVDRHDAVLHNTVLWLAAEGGLVALLIFAGLIWFTARQLLFAYRHTSPPRRHIVVSLILAHLALVGLSTSIDAIYQRHWWFVMGLGAVLFAGLHEERASALVDSDGHVAMALDEPDGRGSALPEGASV